MSEQTIKEKIKIPIEESAIPSTEVADIISEGTEGIWAKDEKSDFWNVVVKNLMDKVAPTFIDIIRKEVNKPDNKDKKVQFTFKGFLFGQRHANGFEMLWRLKMGDGNSGSSGNKGGFGKFPPQALEEVFCGLWTEVNMVIQRDSSKKWYLADTQIVINPNITDANDPSFAVAFVTIKRNKTFKQE